MTNYAKGQTGGHNQEGRPEKDFYETPDIAVEKLLEVEEFGGKVWEPACGAGAIARILENENLEVYATDLFDHGYGDTGIDFLDPGVHGAAWEAGCDHIVTNPPFSQALEFAKKGVSYIEWSHGKMALLLRLAWLESQKRKEFFETSPLKHVWVFSKRLPMMHRPGWSGNKIKSGMIAYAWFVWDADYQGRPRIGWI